MGIRESFNNLSTPAKVAVGLVGAAGLAAAGLAIGGAVAHGSAAHFFTAGIDGASSIASTIADDITSNSAAYIAGASGGVAALGGQAAYKAYKQRGGSGRSNDVERSQSVSAGRAQQQEIAQGRSGRGQTQALIPSTGNDRMEKTSMADKLATQQTGTAMAR